MKDSKIAGSAPAADDFELGMMLGSRKAFASVAGHCSAADAECLRRVREKKLYLRRAATWEEFCPKYLGLSRVHANRIIRYLEEFGPDYFVLAQLTQVTPEQFRAIAPAVREKNIHVNGEAIALLPENSDRIAAAVTELRQAAADTPDATAVGRMAEFGRRFDHLIAQFAEFARSPMSLAEQSQLNSVLRQAVRDLQRLGLERGIVEV
jgi:hypothetical protein